MSKVPSYQIESLTPRRQDFTNDHEKHQSWKRKDPQRITSEFQFKIYEIEACGSLGAGSKNKQIISTAPQLSSSITLGFAQFQCQPGLPEH